MHRAARPRRSERIRELTGQSRNSITGSFQLRQIQQKLGIQDGDAPPSGAVVTIPDNPAGAGDRRAAAGPRQLVVDSARQSADRPHGAGRRRPAASGRPRTRTSARPVPRSFRSAIRAADYEQRLFQHPVRRLRARRGLVPQLPRHLSQRRAGARRAVLARRKPVRPRASTARRPTNSSPATRPIRRAARRPIRSSSSACRSPDSANARPPARPMPRC